jgi:hypothetical protein
MIIKLLLLVVLIYRVLLLLLPEGVPGAVGGRRPGAVGTPRTGGRHGAHGVHLKRDKEKLGINSYKK